MHTHHHWTVTDIAERFEEAAATLRRLPPVALRGYFNTWPPVMHTLVEQLNADRLPLRLGPPSAEAISRMEETIHWMFLLDEEDERRLVWLRAARVPWKPICWRIGCGRTKAWHMWTMALLKVAARLNMRPSGGKYVRT
jgi:hypothetical protein